MVRARVKARIALVAPASFAVRYRLRSTMPSRIWNVRRAHVVLLTVLTLIKGAVWIALIPPFLVADEPSHFDNVQFRAEHGTAPTQDSSGRPLARVLPNDASLEVQRLWFETLDKEYYRRDH